LAVEIFSQTCEFLFALSHLSTTENSISNVKILQKDRETSSSRELAVPQSQPSAERHVEDISKIESKIDISISRGLPEKIFAKNFLSINIAREKINNFQISGILFSNIFLNVWKFLINLSSLR